MWGSGLSRLRAQMAYVQSRYPFLQYHSQHGTPIAALHPGHSTFAASAYGFIA
jgi:hypothetical protein